MYVISIRVSFSFRPINAHYYYYYYYYFVFFKLKEIVHVLGIMHYRKKFHSSQHFYRIIRDEILYILSHLTLKDKIIQVITMYMLRKVSTSISKRCV